MKRFINRLFRGRNPQNSTDDPQTVIGTVDARQGGRQRMNLHVLVVGLILILIAFVAVWVFGVKLV